MKEINIYGDIVAFKFWGENEYDLKDLKDALSSLDITEGETLTINIHTLGGDTTTAFAMYNLLKRFKTDNNVNIRTRVDGYCASSGVILLLAGDTDKRIGNKYLNPFVHNAWTWLWDGVNKDEAKKIYEELQAVDNAIADLYASETSITKEEALQFMNESRDLTTEECKKYGFYSELENVIVVEGQNALNTIRVRNIQNRKNNTQNMTKNKKGILNSIKNQIDTFLKGTQNKIVFTATNEELDFYELGEEDTPKIGDKANFDGKPAGDSNEGIYVMASGETYKFTGEELTEIIVKNENDDNTDLEAENQQLKSEVEDLKMQIANLKKENNTLNKKVVDATSIIKNFNALNYNEEEENSNPRNSKPQGQEGGVRNMFKNIK